MNTSIVIRPSLYSAFDGRQLHEFDVIVSFEGYDVVSFGREKSMHRTPKVLYSEACRFLRLIERGYSVGRALFLAKYPSKSNWNTLMDKSAHDKLTDEVAPFVPEGFVVSLIEWNELAYSEQRWLESYFTAHGRASLHGYCMAEGYDFDEILPHVIAEVQLTDEMENGWYVPHHSEFVSY